MENHSEVEKALYDCLDFLKDLPAPPQDLIEAAEKTLGIEW